MAAEDRISSLPDDVLHHVLSLLPMDAAVRTSVLSKRWIDLWKFIDVINFPNLPELETELEYGFLDRCLALVRAPTIRKFSIVANFGLRAEPDVVNWIRFAIAKHVQSLEFYMNVAVKCPYWRKEFSRDDYFVLPDSFYLEDSELREEIALSCVHFSTLTIGFQGYEFLRRLYLFDCEISNEGIQSVVSACRILESLSIIRCAGLCFPKISSTSLKEFVYTRYTCMLRHRFDIDAPNLVILHAHCGLGEMGGINQSCYPLQVTLYGGYDQHFSELFESDNVDYGIHNDDYVCDEESYDAMRCGNAIRLLSHLTQVQVFAICWAFIPLLKKALDYNGGPSNVFRSLKVFSFSSPRVEKAEVVILLSFLGDCPSLEKIQLQFELYEYDNGMPLMIPPKRELTYEEWNSTTGTGFDEIPEEDELEWFADCELGDEELTQLSNVNTLNRVKTIELYDYDDTKEAREILKQFLLKAVCVERISLFYGTFKHQIMQNRLKGGFRLIFPPYLKQQWLTQVSLLPRASPGAEISLN